MSDKQCDYFQSALREAERGLAVAQHAVGAMYDSGRGVAQDKAAAISWFQKAAGQGHPDSLFLLGVKYRMGDGVERDDERALHYFRLAAKRGRVEGVLGLGQPDTNMPEMTMATEKNLASAQYDLGRMYLEESCWLHDPARAAKWLLLAAEGGVS
ncbi:MAG: sel1 repeat family protein, partial [Deltaproteobacteria bacterium]|nr:sel1 repeat family protein [Deltaproteobacteria bacterium]